MVSVWPPGLSSSVPVGRGGIVGLSERSGYLDYQKKKNNNDFHKFNLVGNSVSSAQNILIKAPAQAQV